MGLTEEKRNRIKRYILEKIYDKDKNVASHVSKTFEVSLNTVYRYIRELERDAVIYKEDDVYKLTKIKESFVLHCSGNKLEEDLIYSEYIAKHIKNFEDNVQRIWQYAFTEMMNNAIEHSQSEEIFFSISSNYFTSLQLLNFAPCRDRVCFQYPQQPPAIFNGFEELAETA